MTRSFVRSGHGLSSQAPLVEVGCLEHLHVHPGISILRRPGFFASSQSSWPRASRKSIATTRLAIMRIVDAVDQNMLFAMLFPVLVVFDDLGYFLGSPGSHRSARCLRPKTCRLSFALLTILSSACRPAARQSTYRGSTADIRYSCRTFQRTDPTNARRWPIRTGPAWRAASAVRTSR